MDKLEIDTENHIYRINGQPFTFPTEFTIKIIPGEPTEVKLGLICDVDIKTSIKSNR